MRLIVAVAVCLSFALPLPAEAQTARLPRKSRSERQIENLNRNIRQERRLQELEQQIQTDRNQFRQEIDRQRMLVTPPIGTSYGLCPPGGIRC